MAGNRTQFDGAALPRSAAGLGDGALRGLGNGGDEPLFDRRPAAARRIETLEPDVRPRFEYADIVAGRDPYLDEVFRRIDALRQAGGAAGGQRR